MSNLASVWPHLTQREKEIIRSAVDYSRHWREQMQAPHTLILLDRRKALNAIYNYIGYLKSSDRIHKRKEDPTIRQLKSLRKKINRNA